MNRRLLLVLVAALGLFVGGRWLASVLGLDSEQIHATLEAYGVWAPALYVLILSARHFIALPSSLALTIGGGLFAVETATIAGSIGLFISALVDFWFFRVIKPEGVMERLAARSGGATRAAEQSTPLILVVATAIPPLPQTMCYLGAAMTDLSFARFAALVGPSGIPRAFVLALLGSGIVSGDLAVTAWAAAAVLIPCALAMSSPRIRAALLPARRSDETGKSSDSAPRR